MSKLDEILSTFRNEIDGFISTDIVGITDGMSIGGGSIIPNFDSSVASAEFAAVTNSAIRALRSLGTDKLEDILFTTDNMYIIVRLLTGSQYYLGLAINKTNGNLGRSRLVMKNFEPKLLEALPR
jgi:predicted regulator of Ras-like GTPase activity (Roadblock/LC7/MglB family)